MGDEKEDANSSLNKMDPVINGVLCYVSSARHDMRSDDIIRICLAFYKENDILK